jgi:Tfp pilus assembly protein PilE
VIQSAADHQLSEVVFIMKSLIKTVVIVASLAASATVFAQSNSRTTREQVRAELVQLQQAGYHVGDGDQARYPEAIQAAEARVAARNSETSGYGGSVAGSSQSGRPAVSAADWNAMYSR